MDFFEKLFGVNPDGGSGSLETLFLAGIVALVLLVVFSAYHWYGARDTRS